MATVEDFHAIEMKIGTIMTAEYIEGADKLLKLTVDFGEAEPRQILSGIREYYQPEELIGKQCPFVTNLEPRTMRGLTSYGMILAVGVADGGAVLLHPDKEVPAGSALR
ncbi:MAG: methionine--tRNA ligase subunit beta [Candidatus Lloydbacteria bacterium RIFCSPHIGHO2_01_FULL_49_22]|uniref:Methionine--tRNA ligase n=1 Tax=Candidatus Lloydbacteria bacterium RIFCSPHIGHO2_01_FULL_49_22 TaxID=1798658 RepID=A0A1G2CVW2_9BACT|nr:MAG: methionine--tRNA ligase subunit beta [Candidatus Lloydbacteria bacterium RIFCSPHIGHO2_01_FULL_49_22]OGZ09807.1 MAG: methionine--tRNA ligase subunit beta [Candidatus Lloydbacteria bacterium RIFCSPHIGHO2_02_FULL_50_18]